MKRLSVLLILPLLLLLFSGCGVLDSNAPPEGYVRIHLLTGKTSDSINAKLTYDENGRILHITKEAGGETVYSRSYTYDEDGNMRTESSPIRGWTRTYDRQGNVLSDESKTKRWVYTYDDLGNRLTLQYYNATGELRSNMRFTYDAEGKQLTEDTLDAQGNITDQIVYTYDENGCCIAQTSYEDGVISENRLSYKRVYDDAGNLLEEHRYQGSTLTHSNFYTYDAHGNLLRSLDDQLNGYDREHLYTYDEIGHLTSETITTIVDGTASSAETYTYLYDNAGNLLEKHYRSATESRGDYYTYDKNGNILTAIKRGYSSTYKRTCTYDENNNKLTEEVVEGGSTTLRVWTYNALGKKTSLTVTFSERDGTETGRKEATWVYNLYGNLIAYRTDTGSGSTEETYSYTSVDVPAELAQEYLDKQEELFFIVEEAREIFDLWE